MIPSRAPLKESMLKKINALARVRCIDISVRKSATASKSPARSLPVHRKFPPNSTSASKVPAKQRLVRRKFPPNSASASKVPAKQRECIETSRQTVRAHRRFQDLPQNTASASKIPAKHAATSPSKPSIPFSHTPISAPDYP